MSTFLFPGNWRQADDVAKPAIETPLGTVRLRAEINGNVLNANQAKTYALSLDARLFVWNTQLMAAELMICRVHEDVYDVLACHAALWRIRTSKHLTDYVLTCRLDEAAGREGSPCSGEWLDAQEWSDGTTHVTVGTQDTASVFLVPGQVPDRWHDVVGDDPFNPAYCFVEYASDGFVLRPPSLEPGEVAQFQFVVAWASEAESYEAWAAVMRSPEGILDDLGSASPD